MSIREIREPVTSIFSSGLTSVSSVASVSCAKVGIATATVPKSNAIRTLRDSFDTLLLFIVIPWIEYILFSYTSIL